MTPPVDTPALVPELDVSDLAASLAVYRDLLGFTLAFERPEEGFAYLTRGPAHLMLQQADGPSRRFRTAPLERPYGRGVNLQIAADDADALHARVLGSSLRIVMPLEERWYRQGDVLRGNRQFVVEDPDGYLLRFFRNLGTRPA